MWASQPTPAPHPQPMESPAVFRNTRNHSSLSISSWKNLFTLSIWMKSTRLQLEALWWHKSRKTRGSRWLLLLKRVLGDSCSICRNVGSCTGYSGENQLKIQWFQFWCVQFPVCIFLFSKFIYFYLKANHNIVLVSAIHQHASGIGNILYMLCLVAQSCPTLCNPMDCSPPGSSVHGDSPGRNTGVGCHALLQGIFPTQGWNPGLLHCRWFFTV